MLETSGTCQKTLVQMCGVWIMQRPHSLSALLTKEPVLKVSVASGVSDCMFLALLSAPLGQQMFMEACFGNSLCQLVCVQVGKQTNNFDSVAHSGTVCCSELTQQAM